MVDIVKEQAREKARRIVKRTRVYMALEAQSEGLQIQDDAIEERAEDLDREMERDFWKRQAMDYPVFIDFEASSLSPQGWPIEIGLAWLLGKRVVVKSKLIRSRPEWAEEDWDPDSEQVHGIPRADLEDAESADDVATWLLETITGRVVVSDAPEFDQRWLDRLLSKPGPQIGDFDRVVWQAFSDGCDVNAGLLHRVCERYVKCDSC